MSARGVADACRVTEWNYRGDGGPTAEDFSDAFNLGASREHLGTVDVDGVALAAIQGLNARVARARVSSLHWCT